MRLLLPLAALLLLLGLLYGPVVRDLLAVWSSDANYSHGFLIPLFAGFLVYSRKSSLSRTPVEPAPLGGVVLAGGLLLLLLGWAVEGVGSGRGGLFVRGTSFIVVLSGLVLLLLGGELLRRLALPLAYLFFMVPLPVGMFAALTLPLQLYAANVTASGLQMLGVPVLREGNLIHLPSVTLGILEACSGIRSLFTLLAGAVALSVLTQKHWWQHAILIASVIPIAIVTNALRTTGTGLLAHALGPEVAQGFFHGFSGWAILVMASVILCAEVLLLQSLSSAPVSVEGSSA